MATVYCLSDIHICCSRCSRCLVAMLFGYDFGMLFVCILLILSLDVILAYCWVYPELIMSAHTLSFFVAL